MVRAADAVVDEVELDLEVVGVDRHAARGQAPRRRVEGDVPPVVAHRHEREPGLADDLRPQVQRVLGRLPLLERKGGSWRIGHQRVCVACSWVRERRRVVDEEGDVVEVAEPPVLARLVGLDDRVVLGAEVAGGVTVG